jgi:hypothetical protein
MALLGFDDATEEAHFQQPRECGLALVEERERADQALRARQPKHGAGVGQNEPVRGGRRSKRRKILRIIAVRDRMYARRIEKTKAPQELDTESLRWR